MGWTRFLTLSRVDPHPILDGTHPVYKIHEMHDPMILVPYYRSVRQGLDGKKIVA